MGQTNHVLTAKEWTKSRNESALVELEQAQIMLQALNASAFSIWIDDRVEELREAIK